VSGWKHQLCRGTKCIPCDDVRRDRLGRYKNADQPGFAEQYVRTLQAVLRILYSYPSTVYTRVTMDETRNHSSPLSLSLCVALTHAGD
jgi:peptidoglycan hydrolase-like protein with peptidoglycan-binding domain